MNNYEFLRDKSLTDYQIYRNGILLNTFKGEFVKSDKPYINFYEKLDILCGDLIVNTLTNSRYYVYDIFTNITPNLDIFRIGRRNLKFYVYIKTEFEYNSQAPSISNTNINIGTANNSIIGSNNNISINDSYNNLLLEIEKCDIADKPLLYEFFNQILEFKDTNKPIKKGVFSKFSDLLLKYAPVAISAGQLIIGILTANK